MVQRTVSWATLMLVLLPVVTQALSSARAGSAVNSPSKGSSSNTNSGKTTIAVCTGIDCRIDGASDCLRAMQRHVPEGVRVRAQPCVGPCGDGPCVLVLQGTRRIVKPQENAVATSWAPPDMFGANPRGVYQVRTVENVERVLEIAAEAAGVPSQRLDLVGNTTTAIVSSTRSFWDRPRNERKALQRLMQFLVLVGIWDYDTSFGGVGNVQWGVAASLCLLSEFIVRENLFTLVQALYKKSK
jgi:hypothetical protein